MHDLMRGIIGPSAIVNSSSPSPLPQLLSTTTALRQLEIHSEMATSSYVASSLRQCMRSATSTARRSSRLPCACALPQTQHATPFHTHKLSQHRTLSTTSHHMRDLPTRARPTRGARPAANPDRGPPSKEDTQTDFNAMDVLGGMPIPTTSVDVCLDDGFLLDSGLRIRDGDGVLLVGNEAFVWRPWMTVRPKGEQDGGIVTGTEMRLAERTSAGHGRGTGGLVNAKGQLEVGEEAWGLFNALWPRPDLIIVGTGAKIRPLAPASRECLQNMGLRIEVLDTRNAASQFNLLATERSTAEVAAALLPVGFGR